MRNSMEGEYEETGDRSNSDEVEIVSASHNGSLCASLLMLKCDGFLCDVTIISGDFEIRAHRAVLASATEYFKAMFVNETKEAESGIVDFSKMAPEIVKQCVGFIYSGKVIISQETVKDLIDASEMIQLNELCQLCVGYLAESIDLSNCAEVITMSHLYGKDSLNVPIEIFLSKRFKDFAETTDFKALDFNSVAHCMNLTRDGTSDKEEQIWKGLLSWTQYDEDRMSNFPKLFDLIDLASLSKTFLKEEIFSHPAVNDSTECLRRVANFYMTGATVGKAKEIPVNRYLCYDEGTHMIVQYEAKIKKWSALTACPCKLSRDTDVVPYKGCIYVGDGTRIYWLSDENWNSTRSVASKRTSTTKQKTCDKCYHWNYVTFEFPADPDQQYCKCIGVSNAVYMVTGDYVCKFDIATGAIERHDAEVKMSRGFFIVASEKKIYIMGNGKAVEYDLKTKACGRLQDMLNRWNRGQGLWYNNKVFTFCSNSTSEPCTVEIYDPAIDQWVALPDLSIPKQPKSFHLQEKLYLIDENLQNEPTWQTIDLHKLEAPAVCAVKQMCVPAMF